MTPVVLHVCPNVRTGFSSCFCKANKERSNVLSKPCGIAPETVPERGTAPAGTAPGPSSLRGELQHRHREQQGQLPVAQLGRGVSWRCLRAAEANAPPLVRAGLSWGLRQRKSPSGHIGFPKRSLWVFLVRAECPSVLFQPFKFIGSHFLSGLRCFCVIAVTEKPLSSSNPLGPRAGVPSAPPKPRLSPCLGSCALVFSPEITRNVH